MAQPWYSYPVSHGYITTYQGAGTDTPHYALDVATPFHTPITAILSGTVVKADYAAWGGEIFIKPDNSSYPEYYYYHPDVVQVSVGQHVTAGQVIALSGGENPGYPGAQHPAQPHWSTGPHTHIGWFTNWASTPNGTLPQGPNPSNLLTMAKSGGSSGPIPGNNPVSNTLNGLLGDAGSALSGFFSGLFGIQIQGANSTGATGVQVGSLPPITLAPTASVTDALVAIDTALALVNPFVVQGAQTDTLGVLGAGVSFTDPISWIEGFGVNLVEDIGALIWRLLLIAVGVWLLFKVAQNFVDVGKIVQDTAGQALQAAPFIVPAE